MNVSTSECSSGCESGWTMYLDQLSNSTDPYFGNNNNYQKTGGNYASNNHQAYQEDEDLSMVSDASSGPPPSDYYGYANSSVPVSEGKKKNKQKNKPKEPKSSKNYQQNMCLDDTASSPAYDFSQGNVAQNDYHQGMEHVPGYSQAYSAAHFESESVPKKHLGFFKSSKGKSSSLLGRKRQ